MTLIFASWLECTAPAVLAHGVRPLPAHGGQVQDADGSWVELIVSEDQVMVYVSDELGEPTPASRVSGTATILAGGQTYKARLSPAGGNALTATLPVKVSGMATATISLKIDGKPASARFRGTN